MRGLGQHCTPARAQQAIGHNSRTVHVTGRNRIEQNKWREPARIWPSQCTYGSFCELQTLRKLFMQASSCSASDWGGQGQAPSSSTIRIFGESLIMFPAGKGRHKHRWIIRRKTSLGSFPRYRINRNIVDNGKLAPRAPGRLPAVTAGVSSAEKPERRAESPFPLFCSLAAIRRARRAPRWHANPASDTGEPGRRSGRHRRSSPRRQRPRAKRPPDRQAETNNTGACGTARGCLGDCPQKTRAITGKPCAIASRIGHAVALLEKDGE